MINTKLLNVALSQIGIKEIHGERDNPEILKYFKDLGFNIHRVKDETAWCSAFMNWVAKSAGYNYANTLDARSWLKIGRKIKNPVMGDIVILWRVSPNDWRGHVGIFIRKDENYIYILGGNQSNKVKISKYRKGRLLGYRRLQEKNN